MDAALIFSYPSIFSPSNFQIPIGLLAFSHLSIHRENWHLLTWKWFLGSTQLPNNWFTSTWIWIVQNECVQIWKSDQVSGTWQGLVQEILSFLVGRILSWTSIKNKYEAKPMNVKNSLLWNYKYWINVFRKQNLDWEYVWVNGAKWTHVLAFTFP